MVAVDHRLALGALGKAGLLLGLRIVNRLLGPPVTVATARFSCSTRVGASSAITAA